MLGLEKNVDLELSCAYILCMKTFSKAFTLTEILFVVAILAIVVAIGLPALKDSREKSIITAQNGAAHTFNDAVTRVTVSGTPEQRAELNGYLTNNDVTNAISFLVRNNFVRIN